MVATVVTVAVTETGETEGMLVLAAMEMAATAVMGVKTAETEETEETEVMVTDPVMAETEAMRVLAASAVRLAAAGVREDMMVLPG